MPFTGQLNRMHEFMYDTVAFAHTIAVPTKVQFFVQQQGAGTSPTVGSGGKGIADTNLDQAQQLLSTYNKFNLRAIRLIVTGQTGLLVPEDAFNLFKNTVLSLYINGTAYTRGPLDCFPAGGGFQTQGQMSTGELALTTEAFGFGNGFPSSTAIFVLAEPIDIARGETFYVNLEGNGFTTQAAGGTTLGRGLLMRCILEGLADRAATA